MTAKQPVEESHGVVEHLVDLVLAAAFVGLQVSATRARCVAFKNSSVQIRTSNAVTTLPASKPLGVKQPFQSPTLGSAHLSAALGTLHSMLVRV
jgi:hypothetical protein